MQWCAECGAEHEDWVSACALCDSPLVDHPPALAEPTDHSLGSVEVRALGPDQRSRLELVLTSSGIPFELGTTARRVAAELVGAVLWGAALTAGGVLADRLGVAVNIGSLAGFLVITLVNVTLVSRIGADPGKLVLGLRVVDDDDRWPTWRQALLRAVVLFGPYWGLGLLAGVVWEWDRALGQLLAWAPLVWVGLIVWSIATDRQRQGWHDRVARTWVIRHRST